MGAPTLHVSSIRAWSKASCAWYERAQAREIVACCVLLPGDPTTNSRGIVAVGIAAILVAIVDWNLSWHRRPLSSQLWLVPVAFFLIAAHNHFAATPRPELAPFFVLDCQERDGKVGYCGSDGLPVRVIKLGGPIPIGCLRRQLEPRLDAEPRTSIPFTRWPEIELRTASGESLRDLARSYDVSYEAIRESSNARHTDQPERGCPTILAARKQT